ncbi:MAG: DUF4091 domain-containing protein [Bacteroidales bacterium]|nr:DUF4091 domain-containing protein [Bacteroidales bacterium]
MKMNLSLIYSITAFSLLSLSCEEPLQPQPEDPSVPSIDEVGDLLASPVSVTQTEATVSWKELFGAAAVNLSCTEKGKSSPTVREDDFKGTSYTFGGLTPGREYTISITPVDADGKAGQAETISVATRSTMNVSKALGIYQIDAMTKVSEKGIFQKYDCDTLAMARGEISSIQVGLEALEELSGMTVTVGTFSDGKGNTLPPPITGWVEYVPSSVNPVSIGYLNENTFADPIIPSDKPFSLQKGAHKLFWMDVEAPESAVPGLYTAKLSFSGNSASAALKQELEVSCEVYPVVVEESDLKVTNWIFDWFFAQMNNGVKPEYGDPVYFEMRNILAETCRRIGQNTYLLTAQLWPSGITDDGTFTFSFEKFDEEVEFFMKKGGLRFIEGSHLCQVIEDWGSTYVPIYNYIADGKGGWTWLDRRLIYEHWDQYGGYVESYLEDYFTALQAHLKEKGWIDIFALHIGDEPAASNAESWRRYASIAKKYAPEIKLMDAVDNGSTRIIGDLCDIMCPKLDVYDNESAYYEQRHREGKKDWIYTCVLPQGEYANRFLCQPLLKTRYLHWENYRTRTDGFLHWGLMYWPDDFYKDIYRDAAVGGLCGGDSYLIYPGYHTLYISTRACAEREGINDYALLKMAERRDPAKADSWVAQVNPDFKTFNLSAKDFRRIRREMLEYLSK